MLLISLGIWAWIQGPKQSWWSYWRPSLPLWARAKLLISLRWGWFPGLGALVPLRRAGRRLGRIRPAGQSRPLLGSCWGKKVGFWLFWGKNSDLDDKGVDDLEVWPRGRFWIGIAVFGFGDIFHSERDELSSVKIGMRLLMAEVLMQQPGRGLHCNLSMKEEQPVDPIVSECYSVFWYCHLFPCYSCAHPVTHRLCFITLYLSFSLPSLQVFYAQVRSGWIALVIAVGVDSSYVTW